MMFRQTQKALFASLLVLLGAACCCQAFHVARFVGKISSTRSSSFETRRANNRRLALTRLYAKDESSSSGSDDRKATAEAEQQTEEEESAASEEPKEDPELVALKQEIANLESALKAKHSQIDAARDQADMYSKAGYARKVAEMENMRRLRSTLNSSSREASMAVVLTNFLPVLDELKVLNAKYKEDEFGSKYNAFYDNMSGAMKSLGVEDFTAQVGEKVILNRHRVVQEEYSEQHAKGTVIRPVSMGLELQGNVIREAECVASLGSKKAEEEAKAAAEEAAASAKEESAAEAAEEGESEPTE